MDPILRLQRHGDRAGLVHAATTAPPIEAEAAEEVEAAVAFGAREPVPRARSWSRSCVYA